MPNRALPDAATDALVAELRDQLGEMRAQRDAWQGISERIALGHAQPKAGKPAETHLFRRGAGCARRVRMAAMLIKRDFN